MGDSVAAILGKYSLTECTFTETEISVRNLLLKVKGDT